MIIRKEQLHRLKELFNLNLYEVKLWTALLEKGDASAGELSKLAEVPRSRSYDILESLEKKGFILVKLGKPITYSAVHPEEIVERFKTRVTQEKSRIIERIDHIKEHELFKTLVNTYAQSGTSAQDSNANGVKGRQNIYARLHEMMRNAKHSVKIATSEQGVFRKTSELSDAIKSAKQNGAKIHFLVPSMPNTEYEDIVVRENQTLNMRFALVDDEQLLLILNPDTDDKEANEHGVWVKSPYVAKAFSTIFDEFSN
ncbi:hypothetical protein COT72_04755 [archaeon CG10_big_fil_rev_8_21_14_0_10_43_11]|nr:MAG: hypothetical protein COT72_04755 [archaeon CG10_big_fil_rev_8_21_14_0_10_43_11]